MHKVFIALGTNLGKKIDNLHQALTRIKNFDFQKIHLSPVYETQPMYVRDQPSFLNMVIRAETRFSYSKLLRTIKNIEHNMGRKNTFRNGPRLIDLDILYLDDLLLNTIDLQIPHPRISERQFVLQPLFDIAPNWLDVRTKKTVAEMIGKIKQSDTLKPITVTAW